MGNMIYGDFCKMMLLRIGTDKKLWAVVSLITVVTMLLQATVPDPELE
ncbi:hypothetical protein PPOP_3140, partial [Paenibacillus popilliae ATCC 14706]